MCGLQLQGCSASVVENLTCSNTVFLLRGHRRRDDFVHVPRQIVMLSTKEKQRTKKWGDGRSD